MNENDAVHLLNMMRIESIGALIRMNEEYLGLKLTNEEKRFVRSIVKRAHDQWLDVYYQNEKAGYHREW